MWFLLTSREIQAGWGATNRARFEEYARTAQDPPGLLAYRPAPPARNAANTADAANTANTADAAAVEPVGWCATGPRARYGRVLRSPLVRDRDPAEDPDVWLVACLFVRRDARRTGVTVQLVEAAVRLARARGATAIEALPLVGGVRQPAAEAYVGTEAMFAACGFEVRARPSPRRLVMRRDLTG
jgi:GNAT superfamily N-acetyltransferase